MNSPAAFFEEISRDREHGASLLYLRFLLLLREYLTQAEDCSIDVPMQLAAEIAAVRPEMSPFHYAAVRVSAVPENSPASVREGLMQIVDDLIREDSESMAKIVEFAREHLPATKGIMLHSHSGTIAKVILESVDKKVRLYISEGRPDCEGLGFAREMVTAGFEVTTFPDDARLLYLPKVGLALLGSDWIGEDNFTNKIGSRSLAQASARSGIPLIVIAAINKLAPSRLRPERTVETRAMDDRLLWHEPLFEETENRFVSRFITDRGIHIPEQIPHLIAAMWQNKG